VGASRGGKGGPRILSFGFFVCQYTTTHIYEEEQSCDRRRKGLDGESQWPIPLGPVGTQKLETA
jgi:hypothetical protein